ncbi:MAG TPA: hypothetical protein VN754_11955 [Candidatus Binataceae bacterium]|nr:hypothetical protein [Candidatus Binataceae bacterium]
MALLTGFSIPTYFPQSWDHTYVLSDEGFVWACFGRSAGGHEICSDDGDSAVADCLSQPNGRAGIVYLVTGVCHQAANRILWPAKLLVDHAGGYGWSTAWFGRYGTDPWPELDQCANIQLAGGAVTSQRGSGPVSANKHPSRLFQKIWDAYRRLIASWSSLGSAEEQAVAAARSELEALASEKLGENYHRGKIETVARIQAEYRLRQRRLAGDLSAGRVSQEQYLNTFSALLAEAGARYEAILGREDFLKLFGVTPENAPRLSESERNIFLSDRVVSSH